MESRLYWSILMAAAALCGCGMKPEPAVTDARTAAEPHEAEDALPRIHIAESRRSLGEVPLGRTQVAFEVFNHGTAELKLLGLETSCGCTQVDVASNTVVPGASTVLTASITPLQSEVRSARVIVHSNDPRRQKTEVRLDWKAIAPISAEPGRVDFGIVRPDEPTTYSLRVMYELNEDGADLCELGNVECRPAQQLAARRIEDETRRGQRLETWELALSADAEAHERHGEVTFNFGECLMPRLVVPVQWTVRRPIESTPSRLFLGSGEAGRATHAMAILTCDEGSQLEVESMHWTHGVLNLDVRSEVTSPSSVAIEIVGDGPAESGFLADELAIICIQPVAQEYRLPVSAFVLASTPGS